MDEFDTEVGPTADFESAYNSPEFQKLLAYARGEFKTASLVDIEIVSVGRFSVSVRCRYQWLDTTTEYEALFELPAGVNSLNDAAFVTESRAQVKRSLVAEIDRKIDQIAGYGWNIRDRLNSCFFESLGEGYFHTTKHLSEQIEKEMAKPEIRKQLYKHHLSIVLAEYVCVLDHEDMVDSMNSVIINSVQDT